MQPTKPTFGFEYWLTEVVLAGEEIKHTTYTQADIQKLRAAWQNQPLTNLHTLALKRRAEALAISKTIKTK